MVFEELKAFPRILRVGHKTQISGRLYDVPRDIRLGREAELKLTFVPEAGVLEDGRVLDWAEVCDMDYEFSADGSFSFEFTAPDEGEYTFQFILQLPHGKRPLYRFSCYALEDDLFELRPYKGDTHVHTCWSCCAGIDQEPPYVAATLRSRAIEEIPYSVLHHITNRITSEVEGINRVLYDLTPKPIGTIEWE